MHFCNLKHISSCPIVTERAASTPHAHLGLQQWHTTGRTTGFSGWGPSPGACWPQPSTPCALSIQWDLRCAGQTQPLRCTCMAMVPVYHSKDYSRRYCDWHGDSLHKGILCWQNRWISWCQREFAEPWRQRSLTQSGVWHDGPAKARQDFRSVPPPHAALPNMSGRGRFKCSSALRTSIKPGTEVNGLQVDHVDSPGTYGHQPAQMMHLPSFAGARGTPQSRPNSAPNSAGQHLSRESRSGSLGV